MARSFENECSETTWSRQSARSKRRWAGAYFGWVRAPGDRATGDVVRDLVVDHDILTIPGTAFTPADDGMIRFSFANLVPDEIVELGRRLADWTP